MALWFVVRRSADQEGLFAHPLSDFKFCRPDNAVENETTQVFLLPAFDEMRHDYAELAIEVYFKGGLL